MKVTELYYLIENLRYILLSEHMYFPAISPFLSEWVTYYQCYVQPERSLSALLSGKHAHASNIIFKICISIFLCITLSPSYEGTIHCRYQCYYYKSSGTSVLNSYYYKSSTTSVLKSLAGACLLSVCQQSILCKELDRFSLYQNTNATYSLAKACQC